MCRIRILYPFILIVILQLLQVSCDTQQPLQADDKPLNVIVIMADDLGYETIGAYGGTSYQTPEIDSVVFKGNDFSSIFSEERFR